MRDFTLSRYRLLLRTLLQNCYSIITFSDFVERPIEKCTILRHDVDQMPQNSLKTAQIEYEMGIKGSYYFRTVEGRFNGLVIKKIIDLGHEIGYHYEDLTLTNGNIEAGYISFCKNLEELKKLHHVKTICMHGSPMSKWDSRDIWQKYDYKNLGIIAEPYFDVNFNQVFYITDTGRMWDGAKVNVRDKPKYQVTAKWPSYHSTSDIINALNQGTFPDSVLMTVHPQRWSDNYFSWAKELVLQDIKNKAKQSLILFRFKELSFK